MKKLILVYLFLLFTNCCFAQSELLDVKVMPNPSDISAYVGKQDYKSVKQRIRIIDDIYNRKAKDTSSIINYDDQGREQIYVLFEMGKRSSITTYNYPEGKNQTLEYIQNLTPKYVTYFRIAYDKQGRKLSVYHAEIQHGDTTSRGESRYDYENELLLKRQDLLNGKLIFTHQYLYNSSELQQVETRTNNSPAFYRYVYQYNTAHILVNQMGYHIRPTKTDTLPPHHLTYENKNLVSESYFTNAYPPKLTNVAFGYDSLGRVNSKNEAIDTLYRKTNFQYNGPYISAVYTKTNTWHSWDHDPLLRNVFSFTKMPVNYETDYYYDKNGYLIKTEEKLNGVIQLSILYINVYY